MSSAGEVKSTNEVQSLMSIEDDLDVFGCDVDSDSDVGVSTVEPQKGEGVFDTVTNRAMGMICAVTKSIPGGARLLTTVPSINSSCNLQIEKSDEDNNSGSIMDGLSHVLRDVGALVTGGFAALGGVLGDGGPPSDENKRVRVDVEGALKRLGVDRKRPAPVLAVTAPDGIPDARFRVERLLPVLSVASQIGEKVGEGAIPNTVTSEQKVELARAVVFGDSLPRGFPGITGDNLTDVTLKGGYDSVEVPGVGSFSVFNRRFSSQAVEGALREYYSIVQQLVRGGIDIDKAGIWAEKLMVARRVSGTFDPYGNHSIVSSRLIAELGVSNDSRAPDIMNDVRDISVFDYEKYVGSRVANFDELPKKTRSRIVSSFMLELQRRDFHPDFPDSMKGADVEIALMDALKYAANLSGRGIHLLQPQPGEPLPRKIVGTNSETGFEARQRMMRGYYPPKEGAVGGRATEADGVIYLFKAGRHKGVDGNAGNSSTIDAVVGDSVDVAELERLAADAAAPEGALEKAGREAEKAKVKSGEKDREKI